MKTLPYRIESGRLILFIRLTPKGGRDAFDGTETGAEGKSHVKARVSAVPEDGKANAALLALIAKKAGVAKSAVSLVSGQTSRLKQVAIEGDPLQIIERLGL
ncbi:MAG: DUF167 family protein [Rhizobiaceae bacterium]